MSLPWWKDPHATAIVTSASGSPVPRLISDRRVEISTESNALLPTYVPDWKKRSPADPGVAFVTLYAELTSPVRSRLNRLPEKMLVEYLGAAGIQPDPPVPATALLAFEIAPAATSSVLIPEGFQVAAQAADDSGQLVVFETDYSIVAVPLTVDQVQLQKGTIFSPINPDPKKTWLPFGREARAGWSLCLGLKSVRPLDIQALSIGFDVAHAPGVPPPASAGGIAPLPLPSPPALSWEFYDGAGFRPAELRRDSTANLSRSGAMDVQVPPGWAPASLPGIIADPLLWLRLRLVYGQFPEPPALTAVRLNVVSATAARTIRDEILQAVASTFDQQRQRMALSQRPVLPGSLILEVDETGGLADPDSPSQRWTEVPDLNMYGPDDKVFVLDPDQGILTFGNGVNGRALPLGFRHVKAVRYSVASGAAGAVDTDKITQALSSAAFVSKVSNPKRAIGGTDAEPRADTIARGPQEIRARSRAVAVADYELLALRAGASITRAHAVSSHHPQFPGSRIPGIVGVFIVPRSRDEGPPIADPETLAAVAKTLAKVAAPAGVEVVTAATRFHRVRAELGVVIHPDFSTADVVRNVIVAINGYIDHVRGGDDGRGWPFGGPLRYSSLLQRLLRTQGILAIPRLGLVVDGRRLPFCSDYATPAHELLWQESHEVIPEEEAQ